MAEKFDLMSIFQMVSPSDFVGAAAVGSNAADQGNIVRLLLRELYGAGAGGSAHSIETLIANIGKLVKNATAEQKKELARVIRVLGPSSTLKIDPGNLTWAYKARDRQTQQEIDVSSVKELFAGGAKKIVDDEDFDAKPFGLVLINSPFLGPQVRDAEKAEVWINSIPTVVMSRCMPYVEFVFGFKRPQFGKGTQLRTMSQMKFLLGADQSEFTGANDAMIKSAIRTYGEGAEAVTWSDAGMEMLLSPQTLVNPNPVTAGSRYVDVLDPFRPFASLLSLTINVTPTAGLYSYKKASAQIKLYDRSRLAEVSDLIRPQVYTQTTVGITYGWRHPPEPGNPYAEFINENMVRREAYGIANSSFVFDADGGVTISLELFAKGAHEMHSACVSDAPGGSKTILAMIESVTEDIRRLRQDLHLDPPVGAGGAEIRGMQLLDAAERGSLPDFEKNEIKKEIAKLRATLDKRGDQLDTTSCDALIKGLNDLYVSSDKSSIVKGESLLDGLKTSYRNVASSKMDVAQKAVDPFIPYDKKIENRASELSMPEMPILGALNPTTTANKPPIVQSQRQAQAPNMQGGMNDSVSFANVYTAVVASGGMTIRGIDEIQTFFYQLNSRAGYARCLNIAEFPVELDVLEEAYADELEALGSDNMTLVNFLTLLIRCTIDDMKSPAYGFRTFFTKNTDKSGKVTFEVSEKDQQAYVDAQSNINGKLGSFQKPEVEVHAETLYEAPKSTNSVDVIENTGRKIMRIHVFDRTVNPYRVAEHIVKDDSGSGVTSFYAVNDEYVNREYASTFKALGSVALNGTTLDQLLKTRSDGKLLVSQIESGIINKTDNSGKATALTNEQIKHAVSRLIPTITYGTNASNVTSAQLSSKQDALLTAAQLTGLNKNKMNALQPNGSGLGGLPLRIIPAAMTMNMLGCPLLNYAQFFFVDFNTGTTADNIYGITGLTHSFIPGKFESQVTFSFYDAYGVYEGAPSIVEYIKSTTQKLSDVVATKPGK